MDMKKHCKYADEDPFFGNSCSNCRANEKACKAWGGIDASKVDSSTIGIKAGVVGLAAVGLIGGLSKRKKKNLTQPAKRMTELTGDRV